MRWARRDERPRHHDRALDARRDGRGRPRAAFLLVALAFGPVAFGANAVDKLTTLFIYVILAVTWNALAGYAGLVSVGQQVVLRARGLCGRAAVGGRPQRLPRADRGGPLVLVGALAVPLSVVPMLRLKGGEFAIGMWVVAELAHLLVNLDTLGAGRDRDVADRPQRLSGRDAAGLDLLDRSRQHGTGVARLLRAAPQPRRARPSRPSATTRRPRPRSACGCKAIKRTVFVLAAFGAGLAGALWIATAITFQPKTYFGVQWTAYMIFMVLVGGLGTFEGAILGAVIFFSIEAWFGAAGVWYLVGLGATASRLRAVPAARPLGPDRGAWGGIRLLPVGYRLRLPEQKSRIHTFYPLLIPDDAELRSGTGEPPCTPSRAPVRGFGYAASPCGQSHCRRP